MSLRSFSCTPLTSSLPLPRPIHLARVAITQASTSATQSTDPVVSTPTHGVKGSRAPVQRLKEPAPESFKERVPVPAATWKTKKPAPAASRKTKEPAAARKGKEPPPAAARKGKEPAPAAARKSKETAPAGMMDKGPGARTQSEHPPPAAAPPAAAPPPPVGSRLRLQGMGWSLHPPPPAAAAPPPPPVGSRPRL
ncbi:hypothetical protein NDU88_000968 [Pleurodeles waltl]|uniref:Uncharacterized protein n=1 Tax=Pleurodeles waltl TaxID=8319 RepID=A0AAV7LWG5_PLEWA|nr:hypothetical protein NDU88_000968 [Pleurodeles waltl]